MPAKVRTRGQEKTSVGPRTPRSGVQAVQSLLQKTRSAVILQPAKPAHEALTPRDVLQMQRLCGNRAVGQMLAMSGQGTVAQRPGLPIQAKLTVGPVGDAYEHEADRVAEQVVRQLNAPVDQQPVAGPSAQRRGQESAEAVQMQPLTGAIQRQEAEEEDLQMQPPDRVAAAEGRGRARDLEATVADLLVELGERGARGDGCGTRCET
jgi:hypothetical protein